MSGATIYFTDDVPSQCSVGIDFFFLQRDEGASVDGLSHVDAGVHILHLTDETRNTRTGLFVELAAGALYAARFSREEGEEGEVDIDLALCVGDASPTQSDPAGLRLLDYARLAAGQPRLPAWRAFGFGPSLLRFVRNGRGLVRTEDCSRGELVQLQRELARREKDEDEDEEEEEEPPEDYELLLSELVPVRPGRTGAARTADALDQSWLVDATWGGGPRGGVAGALAEARFALVGAAVLNNTACYGQLVRVVRVLLHSEEVLQRGGEAAVAVDAFFRFLYLAVAVLAEITDEDEDEDAFFPWRGDLVPVLRSFGARLDALAGLPRAAAFRWGQLQTLLGLATP